MHIWCTDSTAESGTFDSWQKSDTSAKSPDDDTANIIGDYTANDNGDDTTNFTVHAVNYQKYCCWYYH